MKILVLAAGQGKRLLPFTNDRPKCMVFYQGKPIIDYLLEVIRHFNFEQIAFVSGYKSNMLNNHLKDFSHKMYFNEKFDETNMVATMFKAVDFLNDDVIISYSDIVYKKEVLEKLINAKGDVCVVVDSNWRELWQRRMANPLLDAETLKLDKNGYIIEIGKKPNSYEEVEGQYIGLIKFSKKVLPEIIKFYNQLPKENFYDGKDFSNMFMTTFLQQLILSNFKISPVFIQGSWIEVDSPDDLEISMV